MSTLLVSPDGMLGRAFEQELVRRGDPFTARRFPDFDLTRPETLTLPAATRPTPTSTERSRTSCGRRR